MHHTGLNWPTLADTGQHSPTVAVLTSLFRPPALQHQRAVGNSRRA
jgi:hypothetical protein